MKKKKDESHVGRRVHYVRHVFFYARHLGKMELSRFLEAADLQPLRNRPGIYVIQPSGLKPPFTTTFFRCGSAGRNRRSVSEADPPVGPGGRAARDSTIASRCQQYWSNWIASGRIIAFMPLAARRTALGTHRRVLSGAVQHTPLPEYARPFTTLVREMEARFHAALDEPNSRVTRARGPRNEWFKGRLKDILHALVTSAGSGKIILFNASGVDRELAVSSAEQLEESDVAPRTTPRLAARRTSIATLTQREWEAFNRGGRDRALMLTETVRRVTRSGRHHTAAT